MKRRVSRFLVPLVTLALLLAATGCGGSPPAAKPAPVTPKASAPAPAAPAPQATPAAPAKAPEKAAAAAPAKPEKAKIKLGLPNLNAWATPLWAAQEKGLFKAEGLEVEVLGFGGDADILQGLAAGTLDMNIGALTGLVTSINSGQKNKAFWAGYNMTFFEWYGKKEYKSMADVKGARMAVTKVGALTDVLTRYAVKKAGLNPDKDVTILQLGSTANAYKAMEAGQLDATILMPPMTYQAAEKGYNRLGSHKDIAPQWPQEVLFAKESFIQQNPNTIKAFLRAHGRALEWTKNNFEEAGKIGGQKLKLDPPLVRKSLEQFMTEWYPDGRLPSDAGMKTFWEITLQAGDIKTEAPLAGWWDDRFFKTQGDWRK